jgi:hypothetical protein
MCCQDLRTVRRTLADARPAVLGKNRGADFRIPQDFDLLALGIIGDAREPHRHQARLRIVHSLDQPRPPSHLNETALLDRATHGWLTRPMRGRLIQPPSNPAIRASRSFRAYGRMNKDATTPLRRKSIWAQEAIGILPPCALFPMGGLRLIASDAIAVGSGFLGARLTFYLEAMFHLEYPGDLGIESRTWRFFIRAPTHGRASPCSGPTLTMLGRIASPKWSPWANWSAPTKLGEHHQDPCRRRPAYRAKLTFSCRSARVALITSFVAGDRGDRNW